MAKVTVTIDRLSRLLRVFWPSTRDCNEGDILIYRDERDEWVPTAVAFGTDGGVALPGPTGPTGPEGPEGPAGPTGAQGLPGAAGLPGVKGDKGDTGNAGAAGADGAAGATGGVGPAGPQGDPGSAGAQGPAGAAGAAGAQGLQGPAGPKGDTGEGVAGAAGATGPQGAQGLQGVAGPAGADGAPGAKGNTGDTGPSGAAGATGAKGDTGDVGPQGAAGATGAQGLQGVAGDIGPQGVKGDPGAAGAQGPQGLQGIQGATGAAGAEGPTGPAGPSVWGGITGTLSSQADLSAELNAILGLYRTVLQASGSHTAARAAGTYGFGYGDPLAVTGVGTLYPLAVLRIDSADYPTVNALVAKFRVKWTLEVNDVAPTGNFTFGLHPITRPSTSGGTGLNIFTIGAAVTGSTSAANAPAADAQLSGASADFALPASGWYVLGVVTTAAVATSSHLHMSSALQVRNA